MSVSQALLLTCQFARFDSVDHSPSRLSASPASSLLLNIICNLISFFSTYPWVFCVIFCLRNFAYTCGMSRGLHFFSLCVHPLWKISSVRMAPAYITFLLMNSTFTFLIENTFLSLRNGSSIAYREDPPGVPQHQPQCDQNGSHPSLFQKPAHPPRVCHLPAGHKPGRHLDRGFLRCPLLCIYAESPDFNS